MLVNLERALKSAADRYRLRILRILEEGPLCVCQVVAVLGLSQPAVSKHLSLLKNAGLVEDERRGKWVFYRFPRAGFPPDLRDFLVSMLRALDGDPSVTTDLRKLRSKKIKDLVASCGTTPGQIGHASAHAVPAASGNRKRPRPRRRSQTCIDHGR